jgi:hypothetical protein
MISDEQIEQEIEGKGLTAPRVTMADIDAAIASEHYFTAADGIYGAGNGVARERPAVTSRLTFCVIVLKNGYIVTGESACVSPKNFDAELGRKIAKQNALDKCWPLFGFHLASKLYESRE